MSCQVGVQQGTLQGKSCSSYNGKKYYSFEGIPYAKPPVGDLRFRNPEDPDKWTGVRDATKPGNKCVQMNLTTMSMEGSEDCLYLNVYTPSLPHEKNEKLPILFFVHGGRFIVGYGDWYQPDYFIQNNVILITLNYRLHVLGFLCLDLPEAPGNTGLKDCVKALEWVNRNISNFNGDPNNVTVFGESAGAAAVSTFITSDMANGLFSKVIAQSGNCLADVYISYEDPIEKAKKIASYLGKELGDNQSLYDFFINVPLEELVSAFHMIQFNRPPYIIITYLTPVVEKKFDGVERFLDEFPIETIRKNRHKKVPMLIGGSQYEAALFLKKNDEGKIYYENNFDFFVPQNYRDKNILNFKNKLREFYFNGKIVDDSLRFEYLQFLSDAYFDRDLILLPEMTSKYQDDVFYYNFCYVGNLNISIMKSLGIKGTTHGDIIQYQFYRENKAKKCSENDQKIIDFLSEAWCNFAKTGKPTWSNQQVSWEPYKPDTKLRLEINEDKKLKRNQKYEMFKFWMDLCGLSSKL